MTKPKNVMISESLFLEICKFFLLGDQYTDARLISKGLTTKLEAMSARERYAARILDVRRRNAAVETPAAADKAHYMFGPIVDLEWADTPGRCNILEHGTRNVLGQLDMDKAYQVFEAVNAGELAPTSENCGDSYIIL